jgi:hypothetical protein
MELFVESETNGVPVLIVFIWPFSIFIQNLNDYDSNVSYILLIGLLRLSLGPCVVIT